MGALHAPVGPVACIAGKYRLQRRIAHGGMGEVWLARNEATNAEVAIKMLRSHLVGNRFAVERLRQEARLAALLSRHRHIVRVFDFIEEGGLAVVMEYLHGETLHSYLKRNGPRPVGEALAILQPILSALQHAHARGVVHRDLKPTNIFLAVDEEGSVTPKLFDFGISKDSKGSTLTTTGHLFGTPDYMSPEQVRRRTVDARSDIFSFGMVLYKTITGELPIWGSDLEAREAFGAGTNIEPRLLNEIRRALSESPNDRHQSASELAQALREAVGEEPPLKISVVEQPPGDVGEPLGESQIFTFSTGSFHAQTTADEGAPPRISRPEPILARRVRVRQVLKQGLMAVGAVVVVIVVGTLVFYKSGRGSSSAAASVVSTSRPTEPNDESAAECTAPANVEANSIGVADAAEPTPVVPTPQATRPATRPIAHKPTPAPARSAAPAASAGGEASGQSQNRRGWSTPDF